MTARTRKDIERLLVAARDAISHREYVIIGSLSVLGSRELPPPAMVRSPDVDLYPKNDPGRASEVADAIGLGSHFEATHGYYADAVSPRLPTVPEGWEARLVPVRFDSGVVGWFLHPNDAAVSKYVRGEARDRKWIRAGLEEKILSLPTIEYRMMDTFMETDERCRAVKAVAEDKVWLRGR